MKLFLWALLALLLPVLASCSSLYFPPPPQVPLLTQKGEFSGGIYTNLDNNVSLQGAYAAGEHLGVIGNASFLHNDKKKKSLDHDFAEVGLGYYTRLKDRRVLEVYAGLGGGHSKRIERDAEKVVTRTLEGGLTKYFVQVNYSSKDNSNVHVFGRDFPITYGTAMRVSYLQLDNFKLDNVATLGEENVFIEPITYTRLQLVGPVQFQLISGSNFGLRQRKYLKAANAVFNFGIIVNIGGQEGKR
ncbi:hypothetical protein [Hymenobacter cavernae]|uniref:Outer membrane protein beta-barrel domain-containing protein n=1 Tax=Hymenobacter cavernae TaxID=2044852 RepID=A0ABQ1UBK3_9BACT|nr:hypothetical protein [Hymenobacter cavernae]GGF14825.1 hypothetical protein GCM10011383_27520 [Hymenobacter cavernae]